MIFLSCKNYLSIVTIQSLNPFFYNNPSLKHIFKELQSKIFILKPEVEGSRGETVLISRL